MSSRSFVLSNRLAISNHCTGPSAAAAAAAACNETRTAHAGPGSTWAAACRPHVPGSAVPTAAGAPKSPCGLNGRMASVIASRFSRSRPPPPARASNLEHLILPTATAPTPTPATVPTTARAGEHPPHERHGTARGRVHLEARRRYAPTRPRRCNATPRPPRSRTQSARPERALCRAPSGGRAPPRSARAPHTRRDTPRHRVAYPPS